VHIMQSNVNVYVDPPVSRSTRRSEEHGVPPLSSPSTSLDSVLAPAPYKILSKSDVQFGKIVSSTESTIIYEGMVCRQPALIKRNHHQVFTCPESYGTYLDRLENELALMSALSHPNIIRCEGLCTESLQAFTVLEYMAGTVLMCRPDDRLARPSVAALINIALQLAEAIKYLHERGIVHGDLSAYNVMIDPKWTHLKLIDLGAASHVTPSGFVTTPSVGSHRWASPENLRREPYGRSSDVYSFGVILWQMFTGKTPYYGAPDEMIVQSVAYRRERPVPVLRVSNSCPPEISELTRTCLEEDPSARPTIEEVVSTLQTTISAHPSMFISGIPQSCKIM